MKVTLIALFSLLIFASCEKSPKCWGKSEVNEGLILETVELTSNCTVLTNEYEGYVVNTDRDLWYIYYKNFGNNGPCQLNEFDFEKNTIIGMTTLNNCKYKVLRNLTVDETEKAYYYDIKIKECGNCDGQDYVTNWVMIPKIEPGYKVIFRSSKY